MVVFACILMCVTAALVGAFSVVRKRALLGDVISHALLPGVCLAYMISESKSPWLLMPGAFVFGLLGLWVHDKIVNQSKISEDSAQSIVLSVFFGFGIVLLTFIQQSGNASQSGLDKFLFGNAASILRSDLIAYGFLALLILCILWLGFYPLKILSFDRSYALSIGLPVLLLEQVLSILTVLAVVLGIQSVGVVLMAAVLITPAAAARYWSDSLKTMLLISILFSGLAAMSGVYVSLIWEGMPTGPWIVVMLSLIAFYSFLAAPNKGFLSKMIKRKKQRQLIANENILKAIYHHQQPMQAKEIFLQMGFEEKRLNQSLRKLIKEGDVELSHSTKYILTPSGLTRARRIVKLHRLWEMYLSRRLNLPQDHLHDDAESVEHFITPELERRLEEELGFPSKDPHDSEIPY